MNEQTNAFHPILMPIRNLSSSVFPLGLPDAGHCAGHPRRSDDQDPAQHPGVSHEGSTHWTPAHKHVMFGPHGILKIGKILPTNPDSGFLLKNQKIWPGWAHNLKQQQSDGARQALPPSDGTLISSLPQPPPLPAALLLASLKPPSWSPRH